MDYSLSIDGLDAQFWDNTASEFSLANYYQTAAYGLAYGNGRLRQRSTAVLHRAGKPVAMAQFVIKGLKRGLGIADAHWGPLWRWESGETGLDELARFVAGVRNHYCVGSGLKVRFTPVSTLCPATDAAVSRVMEQQRFCHCRSFNRYQTFILDLHQPLDQLRKALHQKWRNQLNVAEKAALVLQFGQDTQMFDRFLGLYAEMWEKKRFASGVRMARVREAIRISGGNGFLIAIASKDGRDIGATVCTSTGQTMLYLLGATSRTVYPEARAGYLLQWANLQKAKSLGLRYYDCGGVPDDLDPSVYRFKERMSGAHVRFPGSFESPGNAMTKFLLPTAEWIYQALRR